MSLTLNEVIFEALHKKAENPIPDFLVDMFIVPLYRDGNDAELFMLVDWLDDNGYTDLAFQIGQAMSPESLRENFRTIMRAEMSGDPLSHYRKYGLKSRLDAARRMGHWVILRLFPKFMDERAIDAVNDFTRTKMREDGFYRRIMPPISISNNELDRFVGTDGPVTVLDPEI